MTAQATARHTVALHPAVRDAAVGLTAAAAAFGAVEVLLQRIAAPVSAHVALPGAGVLRSGGDFAAGATAALVVTASAALAVALRHRPRAAAVLAAGWAATMLALAAPGTKPALYAVVTIGLGALVLAPRLGVGERAPLVAAAVAITAGLWPLVSSAGVTEARTVAEAALVAAPVIAAAALLARRRAPAGAWWAAAVAGSLAAVALTVRLETTALAAIWALGITLALPAVAYVAAAVAGALVVATWIADPAHRVRLLGVALLAVAGLQPAAVHHSLTALLAVALLALPIGALDEGAAP